MNWSKLGGCPGASLPAADGVQKITLSFSGNTIYAAFKSAGKFEVFRTTTIGCSVGGFLEQGWERRLTLTGDDTNNLWNRIDSDPADPRSFTSAAPTFGCRPMAVPVSVSYPGRMPIIMRSRQVRPTRKSSTPCAMGEFIGPRIGAHRAVGNSWVMALSTFNSMPRRTL